MNIREHAREIGGEGAVKLLEIGQAIEDRISDEIAAILTKELKGGEAEGLDAELVIAAMCSALAHQFATATVIHWDICERPSGNTIKASLDCAINCFLGNLKYRLADLAAVEGDTADVIKAAAKRGGE